MVSRRKGPLRAWRIGDGRHPVFDGKGARDRGGRWNSPGREAIYAAATYAGAMLEQLSYAGIGFLPKGQVWIEIQIPAIPIEVVESGDVPGWELEDKIASQEYGDKWLDENRTAVLLVPSVVSSGIEKNVVINPAHKDFPRITHSAPRKMEWHERFLVPPPAGRKK
ncbi:MAG: RES domain-containing protein [Thermodesulfobacteriota bacterium]